MSQETSNLIAAGARWTEHRLDHAPLGRRSTEWSKRTFDIATATAVLLAFMPLILLMVAALLTQGRPLLIRHKRLGRGGQLFSCLKFRTMVVNADALLQEHLAQDASARQEWASSRKLKNDPRVTRLGKVLRKSSLDELPQLLNVLRGEMSLVGPRPIVPAEAIHYGVYIERYHEVRPGLTGAWQVSGRSDVSYTQRVNLDCEYVATRSFRKDMTILLMTVPAVLKLKGSY